MQMQDIPPVSPFVHQQPSAPPFFVGSETLYDPAKAIIQPTPDEKRKKRLKIACCIVISIVVLITIILFFALFLFRKRAVEVTTNNATLERVSNSIAPLTLDLVIGMDLGIKNPNYAGFNYKSTQTKIFYHGVLAGTSPMAAGEIKARSTKVLHSTVYMNAAIMMSTPFLVPEMTAGTIPLSTSTTLQGNGVLFNFIKIQATVETSCDITVNLQTSTTTANCKGEVSLS